MNTFCYLFTFAFEQFISYQYFNNKFNKKCKLQIVILAYIFSFVIQYSISFFEIPYLNLTSFFVSNLIVGIICFKAKTRQLIFNVFLLEAIMIATEMVAMYSFTTLLGISLLECKNNELVLFLETAATKTFYFVILYIISKFSKKETNNFNDYSILLFVLPVSSIATIVSFSYLSFTLDINKKINILFTIISLILLLSNIFIFLIHEKIIDTLTKNSELQLEKQKEEINNEYYKELEKQYDSSNILIHDIKKCLSNIKVLSIEENNKTITKYVDSIYQGYEINLLKQYSKNKLVNVIVSRYANLCNDNNVNFTVDIRDIDFSFLTDSDLTALLDNLLENAYEASKKSLKKEINLSIDYHNENYIFIKVFNSSDIVPKVDGTALVSTKPDKKFHGLGTKSILRIVKKYDGNIKFNYLKDSNSFIVSILLKDKVQ